MWISSKYITGLLLAALLPFSLAANRIRKDDNPTARDIHIVNLSDVKVDIFWVNPQTGELIKSVDTGILKGTDTLINSYIGHKFEVHELARKSDKKCRGVNDECRKATFVVTNNEDQRFNIEKDITISYEDARSRAMEKAKKVSEECPMPEAVEGEMPDLEKWAECLQSQINATLDVSREEIEFQAGVRKNLGRKLVNYACTDEDFPTSSSTYNQTLQLGLGPARNPKMKYLFQSETSKVVLLEGFLARSQCKWLKESAARSGNRLDWSSISDVAIRTVVERMYKALEQVADHREDPDFLDQQRKLSHMHPLFELHEGDTDSKTFIAEDDERHPLMGTFILFCDVADKGGAIHFPKAGVHVKPEVGQGLLVTYLDPSTGERSDDAFTSEFVECPVVEGKRTTLKYHIPQA